MRPVDHDIEKRRVVTVGTVFILVRYQAAGESSLVEALVTTSRALWHVRVTENHVSRAARRKTVGMEGLNYALREPACITEQSKGRAAQAPRRTEAERWSSTRGGRNAEEIHYLLLLGSTYMGSPARSLGISEAVADGELIAACRNITRSRHRPHASLCSVIAPPLPEQICRIHHIPRCSCVFLRDQCLRCCCAQYHLVARVCVRWPLAPSNHQTAIRHIAQRLAKAAREHPAVRTAQNSAVTHPGHSSQKPLIGSRSLNS
jgi:hypothetical protein